MKKTYNKPVTKYTGINISPVMQNLSNGGNKGGSWSGEAKERDTFGEGEEW